MQRRFGQKTSKSVQIGWNLPRNALSKKSSFRKLASLHLGNEVFGQALTMSDLKDQAMRQTDLAAAQEMQHAKCELFASFRVQKNGLKDS